MTKAEVENDVVEVGPPFEHATHATRLMQPPMAAYALSISWLSLRSDRRSKMTMSLILTVRTILLISMMRVVSVAAQISLWCSTCVPGLDTS